MHSAGKNYWGEQRKADVVQAEALATLFSDPKTAGRAGLGGFRVGVDVRGWCLCSACLNDEPPQVFVCWFLCSCFFFFPFFSSFAFLFPIFWFIFLSHPLTPPPQGIIKIATPNSFFVPISSAVHIPSLLLSPSCQTRPKSKLRG